MTKFTIEQRLAALEINVERLQDEKAINDLMVRYVDFNPGRAQRRILTWTVQPHYQPPC